MMITNLPTTFAQLQAANLTGKPIDQFSRDEIGRLIEIVIDNLDGGLGWSPPYLKDCNELVIPFTAPKRYRWWAGGQTVKATLEEIGASVEVLGKYCDMSLKENKDASNND